MSDFLKDFLQQEIRTAREPARVYLTAFGKHPGWNDHIEDIELPTQALVTAKQLIYVEGISSQIDGGVWEKLEPGQLHPAFDHYFLWQRPGETLLGLIVSSRDGKGRARYPMVVCAHTVAVPLERVIREVKPALDGAVAECLAAGTAEAVRAVLARTGSALSTQVATPASPPRVNASPDGPAGDAAEEEGVFRILYEIRGKLEAWAPRRDRVGDETARERGVHLRVSQLRPAETGWPWWTNLFRAQLEPAAPLLFLWSRSARWMDVIVGRPAAADFFALKAGVGAMPLADEVPYELDDAFRTQARTVREEFGRGAASAVTIFGAREETERGVLATRLREGRAAFRRTDFRGWGRALALPRVRKTVGIVAAAGIVTAVVIGAVWRLASLPKSLAVETAAKPGAVATGGAAQPLPAWGDFCRAYFDWFGALSSAMQAPERKQRWAHDPYLRAKLVVPVEQARRRLGDLDPRKLTGASGSLAALAETIPEQLNDEAVRARVTEVAALVKQTGEALTNWPVIAETNRRRADLAARGWAVAKNIPAAAELKLDGDLATAIDATLESTQQAAQATAALPAVLGEIERLAALGDPVLALAAKQLQDGLARAGTLSEFGAEVVAAQHELEKFRTILATDKWRNGVDYERFRREEADLFAGTSYGPDVGDRWRAALENYRWIPSEELRWPVAGWTETLAQTKAALEQLKAFAKTPDLIEPFVTRLVNLEGLVRDYAAQRVVRKDAARLQVEAANLLKETMVLRAEVSAALAERADPTAWLAQKREVAVAGSAVVNAEWKKRREALLRAHDAASLKASPASLLELQERVEKLETFLSRLATAPELPTSLPAGTPIRDELIPALQRALDVRREQAMTDLLAAVSWAEDGPKGNCGDFLGSLAAQPIVEGYTKAAGELAAFGRDFTRLTELLGQPVGWAEGVSGAIEPWLKQATVIARFRSETPFGELIRRAERLEVLAGLTDRSTLQAAAEGGERLGERLSAWRGLGRLPDWPRTAAELGAENALSVKLQVAVKKETSGSDQKRLLEEIRLERARRWQVAFAQAPATQAWAEVLELREVFGVDRDSLDARARFNIWLHEMGKKDWVGLGSESLAVERDRALAEAGGFAGEVPAARTLLDQLRGISLAKAGVDFSRIGPGAAGWTFEASSRAGRLSYTWKGHRLDFVEVPPAGGCYLATTELPVGLFVDWIREKQLRAAVEGSLQTLMEEYSNRILDTRMGPAAYVKGEGLDFEVSRRWIQKLPNEHYGIDAQAVGAPSELSPVNYVAPGTARLICEKLNCRIPEVGEWRAARALDVKIAGEGAPANRRDRTWLKYWQRVVADSRPENLRYWPDGDIFLPLAGVEGVGRDKAAMPAVDEEDGVLWFAEVESDRRLFHHLVGNVAEYVTDGKSVAVIGGSALSPAELKVDTAYPVAANDTRGFSDVGFRLAFSVGEISPAQQIQQLFAMAGYASGEATGR